MTDISSNKAGEMLGRAYKGVQNQGYLSALEVAEAVAKVRLIHSGDVDGDGDDDDGAMALQFSAVDHLEWSKAELLSMLELEQAPKRSARVTSMCVATNETFIDVVPLDLPCNVVKGENADDLRARSSSTATKDAVQPPMSPTEYESVAAAIKDYQPLKDTLIGAGLDPSRIQVDAWCVGYSDADDGPHDRQSLPVLLYQEDGDDIPYSRPLEGIHMRYSLTQGKVTSFDASEFANFALPPPSPKWANYPNTTDARTTVMPLDIVQPEGPSFSVDHRSNTISWQGWNMQVGFTAREGLTLHFISFRDRPVLHKLSVTEMVVPYGDPRAPHSKKAAFDAGEDGFGRNANSLKLGCDCLGLIQYMDANLVNDDGSACRIANAVCIHEEDAGMAWKHTDWRTGSSEVRRARKLIVSYITTIANYDYGFYYEFYQDGRISLDVKLTGVLSTGLLSLEDEAAGERKYGIALGSGNLYAPIHQHFFNARIHPAVDGPLNTLVESNVVVEPLDAAGNDEGNAFYYESRVLASELQAQREDNSDTQRFWKVESGDTVNATGHKTAFRLVAAKTCKPMASMSSKQLGRAGFMKHTLWATAYDKEERYPAGEFPNQCNVSAGLEKWTSRDAALEKTDLVLWYNFGVTHLPRLEDFPVMPVEHTGFHLKPVGFFDASPVMDLPVSTHTGLSKDVDGRSGAGACCDKKEIVDNS